MCSSRSKRCNATAHVSDGKVIKTRGVHTCEKKPDKMTDMEDETQLADIERIVNNLVNVRTELDNIGAEIRGVTRKKAIEKELGKELFFTQIFGCIFFFGYILCFTGIVFTEFFTNSISELLLNFTQIS